MRDHLVVICGATGCGKTKIAIDLALKLKSQGIASEIINADSMQVYNELRTLTAQPTPEQCAEVKHHLYSVISPDQKMNVVVWNQMANEIIDDLQASDILPIIVGGTGFYINSLIDGVPQIPRILPEIREYTKRTLEILGRDEFYKRLIRTDYRIEDRIAKNDTQRILRAFEVYTATGKSILSFAEKVCCKKPRKMEQFVISIERSENLKLIDKRLHRMVENNVIAEVAAYKNKFGHIQSSLNRALGYREFCDYIDGNISLDEAISRTNISSRQYAKRQVTWFKNKLKTARQMKSNGSMDGITHAVNDILQHTLALFR